MRLISYFGLIAALAACDTLPQTARVLCGFADVLIEETDIAKVAKAFAGTDSDGTKVCRAVRAFTEDTDGADAPISGDGTTKLPLPNGEDVPITLQPPS
ncbi:MAG: hypothetical protein ABJP90_11565 [Paracoccaceae bacterium]